MHRRSQITKNRKGILVLFVLFGLISFTFQSANTAHAQGGYGGYDPTVQTSALLYDEARTVYLGNLARRDNGVPPLRWNLQMTHAGRWFSWDSVENRPNGYCGHQDTLGGGPWDRAAAFGYLGFAGGENAFCGYVTPEDAIQGWLNSPGHRANLLDPNWREIGLGYYRRASDGRGYVAQVFGSDAVYAPVIIENEAVSTSSPAVNLYTYSRLPEGGFAGWGAATQMMLSNNPGFYGAAWEPYIANKSWTLVPGDGWRQVYVKTRDGFNRSLMVSDSIYLGANIPLDQLGPAQMSTTQSQVTLYNLNGGSLPQAQFSLGWQADDTHETFTKWWGNGERVNDTAAWGGTAYRLYPGAGESFAWVWDTSFFKDTPMMAYFRLKVNDNTSTGEVARISVKGGGTEYGPFSLRGTDFAAPNQYQEFPINFTFNSNPDDPFLTFQFWRSGSADVYVDVVYIFSAPQPITSPLTWSVPGNNYRGQGVWVRYTNGSQFSSISEAATSPTIPPPTTATTVSPNGSTTNTTPTYTWNKVNTSTWYYLWVNNAAGTPVIKQWYPASQVCGSTSCSVTPGVTLPAGNYTWWIQTWNEGGYGPWSSARSFSIQTTPPPGAVTLVSPTGAITDTTPAYTWNKVNASTWYYLWVSHVNTDGTLTTIHNKWYESSALCGASTCSVTPAGITLSGGNYRWWIQAWNEGGYGPWSNPMNFGLSTIAPPGVATPVSPSGSITDTTPTYTWKKVNAATWYYLWVSKVNSDGTLTTIHSKWYAASLVCGSTTCSITPAGVTLSSGNYRWWVQTWNEGGYGPWSGLRNFNLP